MNIQENSIIRPLPSEELLKENEKKWRVSFPEDYKKFILKYNGGIPNEKSFICGNRKYAVSRFLGIMKNVKDNSNGWYDIGVVESQIGERLTANEDLIGMELVPIAEVFAGDYVCLDYRDASDRPSVVVWSHEESADFDPVTYWIANSFSDFIDLLA